MPRNWGFLTNHALVLVYVVSHPQATVREISEGVGVTERATLAILRQLGDEGIVDRSRNGRRNVYAVNFERMSAYRREGTVALTPREFVDSLIGALLDLHEADDGAGPRTAAPDSGALDPRLGSWGFLTNHALLLLSLSFDSRSTVRELASSIGVTERAVVAILNQLEDEGIIARRREGRRNVYAIKFDALGSFPRWSLGSWRVPQPLVDAAVSGLRTLSSARATSLAG